MVGRIAANHADGEGLGDVLGDRQQLRHRFERPAQIVLIQAGDDDPLAAIGERVTGRREIEVEELPFVDADHFGVVGDLQQQLVGVADGLGRDPHLAVGDDMAVAEAVVHQRLEHLHPLAGNLDPPQPADELFALPAEHAAGDHFDPPVLGLLANLHVMLELQDCRIAGLQDCGIAGIAGIDGWSNSYS
jgi:hypothetical protein